MIITHEMTCLELKQLKTKSLTDVAKVVLANHTGLQACGVIEEGSGMSSGSHDLLHRGGVRADSAELLVDVAHRREGLQWLASHHKECSSPRLIMNK